MVDLHSAMDHTTGWISIVNGENQTRFAGAARGALACLEPMYRGVVAIRNAWFDSGFRKPQRLGRPTISVGNLTTGGTGKTPMVIELARRLSARGVRPGVVSTLR